MDRIAVTEQDIRNGQPRSTEQCPVALAIQRHFNVHTVQAGTLGIIVFETATRAIIYRTPYPAIRFIGLFDLGGGGEPFEFELDAPMQIREHNDATTLWETVMHRPTD